MAMVEGVDARGAEHCETTALGVLLRHEGLDLSEPMLFGLGSGLSFVYWDSKRMTFPFVGGRVKPFELTRNLATRLGLTLRVEETASARRAWQNVVAAIDAGRPVGLQLDCHHLEYFTTKVHFGGHIVAMYGYDDRLAYLVDTAQQGGAVSTSLTSLAAARAERGPMTARNRSFTITAPEPPVVSRDTILAAVKACADAFLAPPIANLGRRGIETAAERVRTWPARTDRPHEELPQAALLMEKGGTGGALFRNLYRDFLGECAELVDDGGLRAGQALYAEAATLWTEVAALIARAGETGETACLDQAAALLHDLARLETKAMRTLSACGA
ncbi:BtrH N-terminal domain-containing protein [Nonomuraea aridisoli]|uniref:Lantibiotic ABC transporter n=1 Tax=Nonomuraea aridisoli TaxID=2070368 RepID=A0A2W2F1T4_9ACTN|nr:BtrH N-terminal domain-containing protein [Nonomuraea aridisoli]PZG22275.1 lantibiotic ABC transporter [Nonomuraea aridisoli]